MTIAERKQNLRILYKQVLQRIPISVRRKKSQIIIQKLLDDPFFKSARSVFTYASNDYEPNTWDFIRNFKKYHKDFYIPSVLRLTTCKVDENLKLGKDSRGVYIPINTMPFEQLRKYDVILVPGLAFDKQLNRLGHGGGWYDKILKKLSSKRKIGLCFKEQVAEGLPTAYFDVKVDQLITD